uniref:5'-deoxynucleotidase n=1 Tax=Prasinoderma singulare TaxID=676789 RepID=A0A7S3BT24_9VIRI
MSPAAGEPASPPARLSAAEAVDFLQLLEKLKHLKRTGWVRSGVAGAESVADHSFRMATLALALGGAEGTDAMRCVKMALVHDVAEALVGDITPHCGVSDEEKHRREAEAMAQIASLLGGGAAAEEVSLLWHEYEQGQTAEAKLVKDLDKLEMIAQASEYEQAQGMDLSGFFRSTQGKWRTQTGGAIAEEVTRRYEAHKAQRADGGDE